MYILDGLWCEMMRVNGDIEIHQRRKATLIKSRESVQTIEGIVVRAEYSRNWTKSQPDGSFRILIYHICGCVGRFENADSIASAEMVTLEFLYGFHERCDFILPMKLPVRVSSHIRIFVKICVTFFTPREFRT